MKTKETNSPIGKFMEEVNSLADNLLDDNKGYVLFFYDNIGDNAQQNSFTSRGTLNAIAECLFSCMKSNPMLANVMIAASNAIVEKRIVDARIDAEKNNPKKKVS